MNAFISKQIQKLEYVLVIKNHAALQHSSNLRRKVTHYYINIQIFDEKNNVFYIFSISTMKSLRHQRIWNEEIRTFIGGYEIIGYDIISRAHARGAPTSRGSFKPYSHNLFYIFVINRQYSIKAWQNNIIKIK